METRLADKENEDDLNEVMQGYWDLWDERLRCHPDFATPSRVSIANGKYDVIMCHENDELVGLMCVKPETTGIYYPVMKNGLMVEALASMCAYAQERYDTLTARTNNQFIHELTVAGGRPFKYDKNKIIKWKKDK